MSFYKARIPIKKIMYSRSLSDFTFFPQMLHDTKCGAGSGYYCNKF